MATGTLPKNSAGIENVRALAFDVFGTVVDWRATIISEGVALSESVDWGSLANDWMEGYRAQVERVRKGERLWAVLDVFLKEVFGSLVTKYHLDTIPPSQLSVFAGVWHRLKPWPDVLPGLARLRRKFVIGTLSNGNMILLVDMERHSDLRWDCVLSAELPTRYKPDKEAYQIAVDYLGPAPHQVMYVAAHQWDLTAGHKTVGMRTAYIPRPFELGAPPSSDAPDPSYDINAKDFEDLASQLGC